MQGGEFMNKYGSETEGSGVSKFIGKLIGVRGECASEIDVLCIRESTGQCKGMG